MTPAAALSTPFLPLWLALTAIHPRLRGDLSERWGVAVPPVQPGVIWVHASSLGEVGAAEALLAHLPGVVLLTADTDSGAARARELAATHPRVLAAVRPVDHPWVLAPLWAQARPRLVIFVEGVYWPQLATMASRAQVPVARVSARAGPRTRRIPAAWYRRWTGATDIVICQDRVHAAWFTTHGRAPVVVGGDLKGARPPSANPLRWERPFLVGASTREGDEAALLVARRELPKELALLIAPRHPRRFRAVAALLEARGERWTRRSELAQGHVPAAVDVVLLDTLGELSGAIQGARAAFVGGTFDPSIGGHSPAEAGRAGIPVVSGPEIHANEAAFRATCAIIVPERGRLAEGLQQALQAKAALWHVDIEDTMRHLAHLPRTTPAAETSPRPWARPLSGLWSLATRARNTAYDLRLRELEVLGIPVVSVGSTNARGAGKTSSTRWIAAQLAERGHRVGIAVHGYRRVARGREVRLSTASLEAANLGDEGALLAQGGWIVAASADLCAAARALEAAGVTVVVVDDGLQHRRLHRDVDLAVVDARFPMGRGVIPMGERRERVYIPRRVHGVLIHRGELDTGALHVPAVKVVRRPGPWHHGAEAGNAPPRPLAAFAGVALPAEFIADLDGVSKTWIFTDHQQVDDQLAQSLRRWGEGCSLVCTAKDWVRLPADLRSEVWWRDIELEVRGAPDAWFPPVQEGGADDG